MVNRELSIDELEAIAAGNLFGDLYRFVKKELSSAEHAVADYIKNHLPKLPKLPFQF